MQTVFLAGGDFDFMESEDSGLELLHLPILTIYLKNEKKKKSESRFVMLDMVSRILKFLIKKFRYPFHSFVVINVP